MYFFISGSYLEFEILELTNLQVKGLTLIKQITIVLEFLNVALNPRFDQSKKYKKTIKPSCNNLGVTQTQPSRKRTNYKYQLQNGPLENAKRKSVLSGHGPNVPLTVNSEKIQNWLKHHAVTSVGINVHQ